MSSLKANGGELRATIQVKRATTGEVETFELIGHTDPAIVAARIEEMRSARAATHAAIVHGTAGAMAGQGATVNNHPKDGEHGSHT